MRPLVLFTLFAIIRLGIPSRCSLPLLELCQICHVRSLMPFPHPPGLTFCNLATDIDSVLADLGQSTTGAIAARHTHLLKAIGVHSQIVREFSCSLSLASTEI